MTILFEKSMVIYTLLEDTIDILFKFIQRKKAVSDSALKDGAWVALLA